MNLPKLEIKEAPLVAVTELIKKPELTAREKRKAKKKKTVWTGAFRERKLKKPNTVAVLFLHNNGRAEPMEVEVKKGFFNIYGRTYHENKDCMYSFTRERTPLAVIPEWSLIPLGTQKWNDQSTLEKFAELQDHVLKGIRHAELVKMGEREGSKLTTKSIILMIILGIIGIAVAMQYF